MPNPWEMDWSGGGQAGPVYGAPPKPEKPDKPNLPAGYQIGPDGKTAERIPGLPADKTGDGGAATEGERNNEAYYKRALRALGTYDKTGMGPRTFAGQAIAGAWGGETALRALPDFIGDSPDRQISEQAKKEFAQAILRSDSGSNAPEPEVERLVSTYFPNAGETDPTVIANYAAARMEALRALRSKAGRLGAGLPEYTPPADEPAATDTPDGAQTEDAPKVDKDGFGLLTGTISDESGGNGDPPPAPPEKPESFWQGVLDETGKAGSNMQWALDAVTGQNLARTITGAPTLADLQRAVLQQQQQESPYQGSTAGHIAGGIAGTLPALLVPGGAVAQGAAAGAMLTDNPNNTGQAAFDTALGAGTGKLADLAFGGVRSAFRGRRAPSDVDMDVVAAGERQGVPIRQPDARPDLRGQYAAAESTQGGGPLIRQARADDAAAIAARAEEIGGGRAYNHADSTAVGQTAQKIAERGSDNVKQAASTLYKRVERSAPGFSTPGTQTTNFIDQKIAALEAQSPTGYSAEITALQNMKADLQKTGLSVETLQAQRMTVGGRIGDNIADRTRADATLSEVLDVASQELHGSLAQANPGAASILKRADAKWGQYKTLQREVTNQFLGKRGDATAETAARALEGMVNGKGNYSALRRYMTLATPEERSDFATTFALEWGRTARGRGEFSPAELAKNLGNLSDRTLHALFGQKGTAALRDLQTITNAKTDAMARQAPSGQAISSATGKLKTMLMGALGFVGGGPGGAAAGAYGRELFAKWGEQRAARMLLNPDFTKLLRQMPNTNNPKAVNAWLGRVAGLSSVAANDNQAFANAVRASLGASPGRVSASTEQEQN